MHDAARPTSAPSPTVDEREIAFGWWPLVAITIAVFMLLLQATVVSVALPAIRGDLDVSLSELQWVIDGYAVTLASLQLTAGSAGDRFGHRRVFVTGVGAFAAAALACGVAPTAELLIAATALQGAAGALMFSTTLALIAQHYRGSARGTAFAVRGTVAGVAAAAGPLLGGAIVTSLSWRWIYLLNLPLAAVAIAIALATLPADHGRHGRRLDLGGAVTFSASLLLLVFALLRGNEDGWTSATIIVSLGGAVASFAAFLAIERRHPDPMLELGFFRSARFTGAQIAAVAAQGSVFPLYVFLSIYFQGPLGYSAVQTGLHLLPITIPILLVGATVGTLMDKLPLHRLVSAGLAVMGSGLLLMHGLGPSSAWTELLPGFLVAGVGIGLALPPLGALAVSVVDAERVGMASGINNTFQQAGFSTGIAVYGAIFAHQVATSAGGPESPGAVAAGLNPLFLTAAGLALAGAALTAALTHRATSPLPPP